MLTFDGSSYDCQGQGEFLLTKAASTESEVQVRFQQWGSRPSSAVTVTTAMAAREGESPVVQVTLAASGSAFEVVVDGAMYDEAAGPATGVVLDVTSSRVQMLFPSGMDVFVTFANAFLIVYTYVPPSLATTGLLGNNNGDIGDDWMVSAHQRRLGQPVGNCAFIGITRCWYALAVFLYLAPSLLTLSILSASVPRRPHKVRENFAFSSRKLTYSSGMPS